MRAGWAIVRTVWIGRKLLRDGQTRRESQACVWTGQVEQELVSAQEADGRWMFMESTAPKYGFPDSSAEFHKKHHLKMLFCEIGKDTKM